MSALESEGQKRHLNDTMIFFFTDNSTVEGALYKGTSSSPKLLELVVRFNALQAHYDTQIIVSHVSGKRMIAQGADGLSRGAENDGTMGGQDIMDFIPLHQSPLERSPQNSRHGYTHGCLLMPGFYHLLTGLSEVMISLVDLKTRMESGLQPSSQAPTSGTSRRLLLKLPWKNFAKQGSNVRIHFM